MVVGDRVHYGLVRVVKGPSFRALAADEDEDEDAWAAAIALALSAAPAQRPLVVWRVSSERSRNLWPQ
jgi:hypothetical protein